MNTPNRGWNVFLKTAVCLAAVLLFVPRAGADEPTGATKETNEQAAGKPTNEEVKKLAEARRAAIQAAQARQAAVRRLQQIRGGAPRQVVRSEVDRDDPTERFVLLVPGGPLIVEVMLHVDGKPFRHPREQLVDELLEAAPRDADGRTAWTTALAARRFSMGRLRIVDKRQGDRLVKQFDSNGNGEVERGEVRQFVATYFGGAAVVVGTSFNYGYAGGLGGLRVGGRPGSVDLLKVLDTNEDGGLAKEEVQAAAARLKTRDADDNDLLESHELTATVTSGRRRGAGLAPTVVADLLGPTASESRLHALLLQHYKDAKGRLAQDAFVNDPELFTALDENENDVLEPAEVLGLNEIPPHIQLKVDLGNSQRGQGFSDVAVRAPVRRLELDTGTISLAAPGVKMSLAASVAPPPKPNYQQLANSYLTRFDKDGNKYIEQKELPQNQARLMTMWDLDEDGKLFPKEIVASYERSQAPQRSQVRISPTNHGNSLYRSLDRDGDGRLGLREMKTAADTLWRFDKNEDGRIEATEIPLQIGVQFTLGTSGRAYGGSTPRVTRPDRSTPEWFLRMDRNGDGDLTLREFLGDRAAFERLDTDNDGFIDRAEAKSK